MDLKQIEKLMASMEQSRIKRIAIKREDFEIEIERECASAPLAYAPPQAYAPPLPPSPLEHKPKTMMESVSGGESGGKEFPGAQYVTSPMVGTFYASPSPDDPHFVKVGDTISEDTVVCIIEAMKVMNEVKAGIKGSVAEILLKNGEPVEFGTRIFRVT